MSQSDQSTKLHKRGADHVWPCENEIELLQKTTNLVVWSLKKTTESVGTHFEH